MSDSIMSESLNMNLDFKFIPDTKNLNTYLLVSNPTRWCHQEDETQSFSLNLYVMIKTSPGVRSTGCTLRGLRITRLAQVGCATCASNAFSITASIVPIL